VTEISDFLGVSPKAVIDHLRKLEEAGLVESRTDSKRRKYFSISRHIRLEVTLSPYEFGTKSAYPASSRLDITACRYLDIELETDRKTTPDTPETGEDSDAIVSLIETLHNMKQLERELSLAQRWAQGRMTELREQLESAVDDHNDRLVTDVLLSLADEPETVESLSREVDVPPRIIEEVLEGLIEEEIVSRTGREYYLNE
jgi:ArsR family transcriptional regulator